MNEKKLLELLAFAIFRHEGERLQAFDMDTWREDATLRDSFRYRAKGVIGTLRVSGISVKISKERLADEALLELITIPPRRAYDLDTSEDPAEPTSGLANTDPTE